MNSVILQCNRLSVRKPHVRRSARVIRHRIYAAFLLFALVSNISFSFYFSLVKTASASNTFDAGRLASTFVGQVAGWNLSESPNQLPTVGNSKRPNSVHSMTDVSIVIGDSNSTVETTTTFLDGKFWFYNLRCPPKLLVGQKSFNECLAIANSTIGRYRTFFNSTSSNGLLEMLSNAALNQSSTVENNDYLLNVTFSPLDSQRFITVEFYKKISNLFTTPAQSIRLYISQSGLLTGLSDYIATYYVATTELKISRDQAENVSRHYAEAYAVASANNLTFTTININWEIDSNSQRGDDRAIYPVWVFRAGLDNTDQGDFWYEVSMWADNGNVFEKGPYGTFQNTSGSTVFAGSVFWTFLGTALTVVGFTLCGTYLKRRNHRRNGR